MVNHYRVHKVALFMIHEQRSFMYRFRLAVYDRPFGFFCLQTRVLFENQPHFAPTLTIPYRSKLFFLGASRSTLCLLVSVN
jgi:hypothetical protein